jgi:beta-lactamase superfamily II metal-dependent hydrolase
MQVHIFDVAHGFCAYIIADNGNTILVDCGHNDETGFYPADYLLAKNCTGIESLFVLNYDEDHVSGLPRLRAYKNRLPVTVLYGNKSISPEQLRALKERGGPLGSGMKALLEMMAEYRFDVVSYPLYPSVEIKTFCNPYPTFEETNNLSLVLFVQYPGLSLIFPGDLEKAGWQNLLKNNEFRNRLASVNVFVASHHGRENGYAKEAFEICKPQVVIVSDEQKQYDTQETDYSVHASGIPDSTKGGVRKVLTTRKDGMLLINSTGGDYRITTSK